jgi:hypothetical protein
MRISPRPLERINGYVLGIVSESLYVLALLAVAGIISWAVNMR